MKPLIKQMAPDWHRAGAATEADIQGAEQCLGVRFPKDYSLFLKWSNGGEGSIGPTYLSVWPTDEIEQLNSDYQIGKYLPGVVGIGTDGGGECFALDYRSSKDAPSMIQVPLGALGAETVTQLAASFQEWIENALNTR